MQINLTKSINALAPMQITDLIDVDLDTIKEIARASNGAFLTDRADLSAVEFLAKYFADYDVYDTIEKQQARRKSEIIVAAKAKKAKDRSPVFDQYGNYIVTLWESGNEFAASYRKTAHMQAHWDVLTKNEIEYKLDGRRFSVVHHVGSRKEALNKKNELIAEMEARGLIYKGEMPV